MKSSYEAAPIPARDISLTFVKGMKVLKAFDAANTHLSLADIARITGFDRAAVRRLVLTLVHLGYVGQKGRFFHLTPRILVLAGGFLQGHQFGKVVQPILTMYSKEVGEPISLAMIDGEDAVYVAQSTLDHNQVTIGFTIGSRLPLLHSSIGRMLLAYGGPEQTAAILAEGEIVQFTGQTKLDRAAIAAEVSKAAEDGYAFVDSEFEAGVAAIAVPVGRKGATTTVIGISAKRERFQHRAFHDDVLDCLRRCGSALEQILVRD